MEGTEWAVYFDEAGPEPVPYYHNLQTCVQSTRYGVFEQTEPFAIVFVIWRRGLESCSYGFGTWCRDETRWEMPHDVALALAARASSKPAPAARRAPTPPPQPELTAAAKALAKYADMRPSGMCKSSMRPWDDIV